MASMLLSLGVFSSVVAISGAMTVSGLNFSAETVAKVAAATPVKTRNLKPSYISRMPDARPEELNIARPVPVASRVPRTAFPLEALPAPNFTHTVAVESLRVRSGPRKTHPQIFALRGGTPVRAGKQEGSWIKIDAGDGRVGWVAAKLLRRNVADE